MLIPEWILLTLGVLGLISIGIWIMAALSRDALKLNHEKKVITLEKGWNEARALSRNQIDNLRQDLSAEKAITKQLRKELKEFQEKVLTKLLGK